MDNDAEFMLKQQYQLTMQYMLGKYANLLWATPMGFAAKHEPRDDYYRENAKYVMLPAHPARYVHDESSIEHVAVVVKINSLSYLGTNPELPVNPCEHHPDVCTSAMIDEVSMDGKQVLMHWLCRCFDNTNESEFTQKWSAALADSETCGVVTYANDKDGASHLVMWDLDGNPLSSYTSRTYAQPTHIGLAAVTTSGEPSEGWFAFFHGYGSSDEAAKACAPVLYGFMEKMRKADLKQKFWRWELFKGAMPKIKGPAVVSVTNEVMISVDTSDALHGATKKVALLFGLVVPFIYLLYTFSSIISYSFFVDDYFGTELHPDKWLHPSTTLMAAGLASGSVLAILALSQVATSRVTAWVSMFIRR